MKVLVPRASFLQGIRTRCGRNSATWKVGPSKVFQTLHGGAHMAYIHNQKKHVGHSCMEGVFGYEVLALLSETIISQLD